MTRGAPHPPVEQQVVVITGASSGIGRVTARAFADRGASVVLASRGGNTLVSLAYEIGTAGGRALPVVCDVSDWNDVRALARRTLEEFGRIDTWINGAAVAEWAELARTEPDEMTRIIRTNLLGTMFGTRAALDAMRPRGSGVIINIASVEARRPLPFQSAYAASKHGVKGFTDAVRMELARSGPPLRARRGARRVQPHAPPQLVHARLRAAPERQARRDRCRDRRSAVRRCAKTMTDSRSPF
jgi:NAD(P)-dependent dehydrogenase (short-subunit alcohol dehydrogenase family)